MSLAHVHTHPSKTTERVQALNSNFLMSCSVYLVRTLLNCGQVVPRLTSSGCQSAWCPARTPWSARRWQQEEKQQPVSQIWPWQPPAGLSGTPSPPSWYRARCMLGRQQMFQSGELHNVRRDYIKMWRFSNRQRNWESIYCRELQEEESFWNVFVCLF